MPLAAQSLLEDVLSHQRQLAKEHEGPPPSIAELAPQVIGD